MNRMILKKILPNLRAILKKRKKRKNQKKKNKTEKPKKKDEITSKPETEESPDANEMENNLLENPIISVNSEDKKGEPEKVKNTKNSKNNKSNIEEDAVERSPDTQDSEEENRSSSSDEDWTYESGKTKGLKKGKPPLLDLDNLKKVFKTYDSAEQELDEEFVEAGRWVGIIMSIDDFRKFIWSHKGVINDTSVIYADIYDKNRQKAIKDKVEKKIRINGDQLIIEDYYMTSKGGYIAWVKTDPRLVQEIHRRAQKSALKDFRTTIFVPKAARDRKSSIDRLLVGYKKINNDFRYLVRNGQRDLQVLIKRVSEGERVPYRELSLNVLGQISPLKTTCKQEKESEIDEETETEETEEGFTKTGSGRKKNKYVPKEDIYKNLTSILNGFELQTTQERTRREQNRW